MVTKKSLEEGEKKELRVSVSQMTTYDTCQRKWWFSSHTKMPKIDKGYFSFGTILHAVCERYLLADMQGRDTVTGKPVNLYPWGWASCEEGRGEFKHVVTMTPAEQELIRKIITTAIEEGFLFREENMLIEKKFNFILLDEPDLDMVVRITGFIDVMDSEGIQDHKTVGNWRYAKSPKSIVKDVQMLVYAAVWIMMAKDAGRQVPKKIKLQHNQYGKDPRNPKTRKVVAHITERQAEGMMTWARNTSRNMIKSKQIKEWEDVEEATPESGACNKYGGCEFLEICTGRETIEKYKERVLRVNSKSLNCKDRSKEQFEPKMKIRKTGTMGLFDDKMKKRATNSKAATEKNKAPAALRAAINSLEKETAKEAKAATKKAEPETTTVEAPPWAKPECRACQGAGFNTEGNPCRICDASAKKRGVNPSGDYVIEEVEGEHFWELKDGGDSGSTPTENSNKKTKTKVEVEDNVPEDEDEDEDTVPEDDKTSGKKEEIKTSHRERGRPKKGFTLYVGCNPTRGISIAQQIQLEDLLHTLRKDLAEANGEEDYFAMNAFSRRDAMCAAMPEVALDFGTKHVSVRSRCPDIDPVVDVLRGLASIVVEA